MNKEHLFCNELHCGMQNILRHLRILPMKAKRNSE